MSARAVRVGGTRPAIEMMERRMLLSGDPLVVPIGEGAAKAVQFTDANGIPVMIALKGPGAAMVNLDGTNLTQSANANGVVVSGAGITLGAISVTSSTMNSILQIGTRGAGTISSGGISANSALGTITAPHVVVSGDITTPARFQQVSLAGAENGTISMSLLPDVSQSLTLSLGNVENESVNSGVRISALAANQWIVSDGGNESIQAPQIVGANIRGGFDESMTLVGAPLKSISLSRFHAGAITGGTWNIGGSTALVQAGSITGLNATFNGLCNSIVSGGDMTANITAGMMNSVIVRGNLINSSIQLAAPLAAGSFDLATLAVRGQIIASTIRSAGNLGTVAAGGMQSSAVYAGVMNLPMGQGLPASSSDFAERSEILTVALRRSLATSFQNSDVAAFMLGNVSLGRVLRQNSGVAFGVAAHQLHLVSLTDAASGVSLRVVNPLSTATFDSLVTTKGLLPGDFTVRIT